ncbi:MAG: response regulator transcription factor [Rhizobiaceae bacterium]
MYIALEDRVHFGDVIDREPVEERRGRPSRTSAIVEKARSALRDDASAELVAAAAQLMAAGYRVVAEPVTGGDRADPSARFSQRERQVLELLGEGAPNKVIARRLDISAHTAKFHVASILSKLGAANRTDAIAIAMREGLLDI